MADEPSPPTREALEALTKDQLAETYDVSKALAKDAMVDAILAAGGTLRPAGGTVRLAVAWPVDSHTDGDLVISQEGTDVPANKAKAIIEAAASAGVTIREVN